MDTRRISEDEEGADRETAIVRCTFFCISMRSAKSVPRADFYAELERKEGARGAPISVGAEGEGGM